MRLAADVRAWWERFGEAHGEEVPSLFEGPLGRPLAAAAVALARTMGTPAPPPAALSRRRGRWLEHLAAADRPETPRTIYAQVALVDLLAAPPGQARRRIGENWFPRPEYVTAVHGELASRVGAPILRVASFARTLVRMPRFLWRMRREGA